MPFRVFPLPVTSGKQFRRYIVMQRQLRSLHGHHNSHMHRKHDEVVSTHRNWHTPRIGSCGAHHANGVGCGATSTPSSLEQPFSSLYVSRLTEPGAPQRGHNRVGLTLTALGNRIGIGRSAVDYTKPRWWASQSFEIRESFIVSCPSKWPIWQMGRPFLQSRRHFH